jgi:hypothetical protein
VHASSEAAAEAIETKVIPREYHDAIKHYFGNLQKESDDTTGTTDKAPAPASGDKPKPESSSNDK